MSPTQEVDAIKARVISLQVNVAGKATNIDNMRALETTDMGRLLALARIGAKTEEERQKAAG